MKRAYVLFLCLIMAFMVIGCGKEEDDYDKVDHIKNSVEDEPMTPTATPTPTEEPAKPLVLCLDPGHGGRWEGAIYHGQQERYLVLKLSKEIRAYINEHYPEITVYLTREDNETFSSDIGPDLRQRVEFAKNCGAQLLVSIHLNASEKHNLRGTMVCISKQPNIHDISVELANRLIQATGSIGIPMNGKTGYVTRDSGDTFDENGVPVDYYAICRHGASLNLPAVILESCFMDNDKDYEFIKDDAAIKRLAAVEAEAIARFMIEKFSKK